MTKSLSVVLIIIGVVLILGGSGAYLYYTANFGGVSSQFSDALYLIQDNLAEVTAVKIMGDSLTEKKPLISASWERINIEAQMVSDNLKNLSVPKELESYKEAAIVWVNEVGIAALAPKFWGGVAENPGIFDLKLSDGQAKQLFENSVLKISELKEFGDNAIKNKSDISMLYIGAKLRVERYWLDAIAHSEKAGLFGFNFVSAVSAALPPVPEVGSGHDVTCQVCADPSVKMTDYQRQMYGCDTRCKPSDKQMPLNTERQNQTGQSGGGQINQNTSGTNSGQAGGTIGGTADGTAGTQTSAGDYQTPTRRICIGRGGTSTGSNGPTNVYCLEDVLQSTNGIDASAIDFAEGKKDSNTTWDNGWHNLEGMGVISTGEPSSSGNSPTVQKFYDECAAKGGTVGGAGLAKSRLPTTESGYTCNYKIDNGHGGATDCWALLTYSGGGYMGGNEGCAEQNLLPNTAKEKAQEKVGGKWDGHYTGSLTASCQTTIPERPTYAATVPVDFTVVNNVTYDSTVNVYVSVGDSGAAIESFQTSAAIPDGTAYVSAVFYFGFNPGGFSGSGSMDVTGVQGETINYASCALTGSGARQ
jgi:hypothetical protein